MLSSPPPMMMTQQEHHHHSSASSPSPQAPYPSPSQIVYPNTNNYATTSNNTTNNRFLTSSSQSPPAELPPTWSLEDFEFGKQIGEGRFGTVYLAREKTSGYKVAIKAIRKEDVIRLEMKHQLEREVRLQKYCSRHPHVLGMFAYFWDEKFVYCVMEYADGGDLSQFSSSSSLSSVMNNQNNNSNDEATVACWMRQLLDAVSFLHSKNILHRDIKPENIMLKRGRIKLGDFTWCVTLGKEAPFDRRRTICGTLDYLSPELISHIPYDQHLDIWSIGVVAYELLVGKPPFEHPRPVDTCLSIQRGDFKIPEGMMSSEAEDFLKKILIVEPERRASCKDLLNHPWIAGAPPTPMSERRKKYLQRVSSKSRSRSRNKISSKSRSRSRRGNNNNNNKYSTARQEGDKSNNTNKNQTSSSTTGVEVSHHHHHTSTTTAKTSTTADQTTLSMNQPSFLTTTSQQQQQQQRQEQPVEEEENVSRALELSGIEQEEDRTLIPNSNNSGNTNHHNANSNIINSTTAINSSAFGEYQISVGANSSTNKISNRSQNDSRSTADAVVVAEYQLPDNYRNDDDDEFSDQSSIGSETSF